MLNKCPSCKGFKAKELKYSCLKIGAILLILTLFINSIAIISIPIFIVGLIVAAFDKKNRLKCSSCGYIYSLENDKN